MNLEESKIYKALYELPFHKVSARVLELTEAGRDVNQKDAHGRTFLHHIALSAEKFSPAQAVPVIYQLALAGIDINAPDDDGDTALHKIVRYNFTHRLLVALIRCGADLSVKDGNGQTVEDLLNRTCTLPQGNPMLFWFNQFKPGLSASALSGDVETTTRLLSSWCRARYWREGKRHNLISDVTSSPEVPNKEKILHILEEHAPTSELAISVLAGSTKRVANAMQKGVADINAADVSYTYHYPNSPRVPQPLLAAAWEQDNYDLIDLLMTFKPNTSRVYVNHRWKQPMPLFFHALIGKPKPNKISITNRIIRGSDLKRTNCKGQTILFSAIKENLPVTFIKALLKYGVDIASRDHTGTTARDYALSFMRTDCVECLDKHVYEAILNRRMTELEHFVMRGYGDELIQLVNAKNQDAHGVQHDLAEKRTMQPVRALLESIPKLQDQMSRAIQAVTEDRFQALKKVMSAENCRMQNLCGQTALHWAVLKCRTDAVQWLGNSFPQLLNICDNVLRTPLHYAVCIYGKSSEIARILSDSGASWEVKECLERTPLDYAEENMEIVDHEDLRQNILDFYTNVYVTNTRFDFRLKTAITTGSRDEVEGLIHESTRHEIPLGDYSEVLFDCIDMHRPQTALYLIDQGADPDIYARYEACDPDDPACLEKRCRHPIISLQERAEEMGYEPMAQYIEKCKSGQVTPMTSQSRHTSQSAASSRIAARSNQSTPFSEMTSFSAFL